MIEFRFRQMPTKTLSEEIERLRQELEVAGRIMRARQGQGRPEWACEVCGQQDADPDKVIRHLQVSHRYPKQDAEISVVQVYS